MTNTRARITRMLALGVLVGGANPAAAAPPDADAALDRADGHYRELDYEQAIDAAAQVSADAPIQTRIDALLITALAHLALIDPDDPGGEVSAGHQDAAEAAMRGVLELAWDFELDRSYSAGAHAAFAAARVAFEADRAAAARARCGAETSLRLDAPAHPRGGRPFDLTIELDDAAACARTVRVTWARDRVTTSTLNRLLLPVRGGAVRWRVPAEVTTSTTGIELVLYAEAFDEAHGRLATLGSFDQPYRVDVAPGAPPPPVYRRWWFWTAIGVAAIGTGLLIDHALDAGPSAVVIRL